MQNYGLQDSPSNENWELPIQTAYNKFYLEDIDDFQKDIEVNVPPKETSKAWTRWKKV